MAPPIRRRALRLAPALVPIGVLLAFWIPGANQGGWRVDTGLYAAIARFAYESSDLFHLHAGDQPYFNKPPLAFWIHGLFLQALGTELWVARLPSLLAAMATTLVTVRSATLFSGPRVGAITGLALATTLEFFRYTRAISLDLWLALWLMCAIWICAESLRRDRPALITLVGLPIGLALLTKPLIALFALPIVALALLWMGRARFVVWLAPGALLALLVAAPWHIEMMRAFPGAFAPHYFGSQTLDRAIGDDAASEPWWTYLARIAATYWPWLPAAIFGAAAACAPRTNTPDAPARGSSAPAARLCALWIGAWLIAFSLSAGKAGRYAILLYPCMAWLAAIWLARRSSPWITLPLRAAQRWLAPAALVVAVALAAFDVPVHKPESRHWSQLRAELARRGDPVMWAGPEPAMRWTTSNIYLMTGHWPRTAMVKPALLEEAHVPIPTEVSAPSPGDLMVFRASSMLQPRASDEVVWRSGDLLLVRIVAPWDGALTFRAPGAPPSVE